MFMGLPSSLASARTMVSLSSSLPSVGRIRATTRTDMISIIMNSFAMQKREMLGHKLKETPPRAGAADLKDDWCVCVVDVDVDV